MLYLAQLLCPSLHRLVISWGTSVSHASLGASLLLLVIKCCSMGYQGLVTQSLYQGAGRVIYLL